MKNPVPFTICFLVLSCFAFSGFSQANSSFAIHLQDPDASYASSMQTGFGDSHSLQKVELNLPTNYKTFSNYGRQQGTPPVLTASIIGLGAGLIAGIIIRNKYDSDHPMMWGYDTGSQASRKLISYGIPIGGLMVGALVGSMIGSGRRR
jgi:hypothetical protein